jgi:hypothetical protein
MVLFTFFWNHTFISSQVQIFSFQIFLSIWLMHIQPTISLTDLIPHLCIHLSNHPPLQALIFSLAQSTVLSDTGTVSIHWGIDSSEIYNERSMFLEDQTCPVLWTTHSLLIPEVVSWPFNPGVAWGQESVPWWPQKGQA